MLDSLNITDMPAATTVNSAIELGRWQAGSHFLNGKMAEVIVIDEVMTDPAREEIQCYLSQKYNIAISHSCP